MSFKTLVLCLFCFFVIVNSIAQPLSQTIKGTIVDDATNAPVPFAAIAVQKLSRSAASDSLGNFFFDSVPVGRYNINISAVGYEPIVLAEIVVSSSKQTVLAVALKRAVNALSEVVIRPRLNKEVPLNSAATVSARMLSVEEARRYAGGFDDPARLVSAFAGVSSGVANNGIVVRGNSPKSLQWRFEGIEISNPNHFADLAVFGGGGLSALSSQSLANSDFFSGAFPAEYNNALSGVFDITMRSGNNSRHEHTFQLGLTGIDLASEGPFKKGKSASYLFNYRYSTLALIAPLMPDNGDGVKYQDLSFKFTFPTENSGTFSVWGIGLVDRSGQKAENDINT